MWQYYFRHKKMMHRYLPALFLLLCSHFAFAATIKGTVTDSKNNGPLTGVVISVTGTTKGAVTDIDGKYEIAGMNNGNYEVVFTYATYKTYTQAITITAGTDVVLDMKMMPELTELKGGEVRSARITYTENAVINEIKASSTVVSGTSAAQITKTMDRNAADVVKRIPGVTIQDDRFIIIRGLPDRYNTVFLNDAATPSSESDKRAFSFDMIPAGLIDRVLIFKTPSPELPGDFAGGMVKVYTSSLPETNKITFSLQTSRREGTTGTDFNYNNPTKTDWMAKDDGSRNIPGIIPDFISTKDPNYKTNIAAWSKAFGNDWVVNSTKANPDMRASLAASNVFKLGKVKIGNTIGGSYSNTFVNYHTQRQDWDSIAKVYNYDDQRSANTIAAGGLDNLGIAVGSSKIEFKNLYNQVATTAITLRKTIRDTANIADKDEKAYSMAYENRRSYAGQLTGTHKNKADTRKYTWALGMTDLVKNQPNRRVMKYVKDPTQSDSFYKAQLTTGVDILNGGRFYAKLTERAYSFNHQFTQTVKVNEHFAFDVSAGDYVEYKTRKFKIRQLGYGVKSGKVGESLKYLPINEIFADSNVDGDKKFKIGESTNLYDEYDGSNTLVTGFVSVKVPAGKHVSILGGVRYEDNTQAIKAVVNTDTIEPSIRTKFLLPSVNATYNLNEKNLLRVAYGKTLNRPEFREWAPIFYYDFDELSGYKGSMFPTTASRNKKNNQGDTLKVAQIQNLDVRYELYPSAGEMIQIGGFYKSFKDPIQKVLVPSSSFGDNRTFTFINADKAYCYGVELDLRKNLTQIDKWLGTEVFSDFTLVGNLTLAKSRFQVDTTVVNGSITNAPLQGQSPYIINAGVFYQSEKNGLQGSLLYNVSGPRMYAIGTDDAGGESLGEMQFQSLDFTLAKSFLKHYGVNIGVQNLLNSRMWFMKDANRDNKFSSKDDKDFRTYYPGRYFTLGVKIKF
jgi:hypothetical protein